MQDFKLHEEGVFFFVMGIYIFQEKDQGWQEMNSKQYLVLGVISLTQINDRTAEDSLEYDSTINHD